MNHILKEIADDAKALVAKAEAALKPAEQEFVQDVEAAGSATASYIKANALQDGYKIALSVVGGAATGQPWATTLATILSEAKTAGVAILQGAEAILGAQAQADLIAAGKLLPPAPATAATPASAA